MKRKPLKEVLKTKPLPFQFKGIRFLWERQGRGLIADDMGLGKTLQSLGFLAMAPSALPALVVCPSTLKWSWEAECRQHTYLSCTVLGSRVPNRPDPTDLYIINYDVLGDWVDEILGWGIQTLIMDECHYIKERRTKRSKACKKLASGCTHVIGLSGTPILNRPVELYPILNMVAPKEFRSFWDYAMNYCDPKPGFRGRGWDFKGISNANELRQKTEPHIIRRLKSEVLTELPPKRRVLLPVDIDNRAQYQHAREDFLAWYRQEAGQAAAESARKAIALVQLGKLRETAAQGKLSTIKRWVEDFLEETKEKLVVFAFHRAILSHLQEEFLECAKGGGKDSKEAVERFQTDKTCRLFVGSIMSDGVGITLTKASKVLFCELPWTPSQLEQAEDRIHRIGQAAASIECYYMIGKRTIDEHIWDLLVEKQRVIGQVVEGGDYLSSSSSRSIADIVRSLRNE